MFRTLPKEPLQEQCNCKSGKESCKLLVFVIVNALSCSNYTIDIVYTAKVFTSAVVHNFTFS